MKSWVKPIAYACIVASLSACGGGGSSIACEDSERMLEIVNAVRASNQRCGSAIHPPAPALVLSDYLQKTSSEFARDLANNKIQAGHVDSQGRGFSQRVQGYAGENSAAGTSGAQGTNQAFVDSAGHCENIMHSKFRKFGAACAVDSSGREYWVQHFSD